MKQTATFIFFVILLVSCGSKEAHIGQWSGTVLMVKADYQFSIEETFVAETYASNNIMIGGGFGTYTLEGEEIILNYEKKYVYDSQNDTGEWVDDDKKLVFIMEISGNQMTLTRQGSSIQMVLQRQ